jgi:hypothetical protein
LFGIIGRLADAPLIPLPGITGNDVSRPAVESDNPAGIPTLDIGSGQRLRLLANGIAGRQGFETTNYAFLQQHRNAEGISKFRMPEEHGYCGRVLILK